MATVARVRYHPNVPLSRHRRVAAFWNWLPGFRAAAEYESIHRAALALGVSASALSRTVRLLEHAVGAPLFVRTAGGIGLTTAGATLLAATRDAMRTIDDALHVPVTATTPHWTLAACGPYLPQLLARSISVDPALLRDATLRVRSLTGEQMIDHLLRGDIDLALVHDAGANKELTRTVLGTLVCSRWGVAGAVATPLIVAEVDRLADEGALRVDAFDAAIELARQSRLSVRCPDVLAPGDFIRHGPLLDPRPVVALMRKPLAGQQRPHLDQLVASLQALLA